MPVAQGQIIQARPCAPGPDRSRPARPPRRTPAPRHAPARRAPRPRPSPPRPSTRSGPAPAAGLCRAPARPPSPAPPPAARAPSPASRSPADAPPPAPRARPPRANRDCRGSAPSAGPPRRPSPPAPAGSSPAPGSRCRRHRPPAGSPPPRRPAPPPPAGGAPDAALRSAGCAALRETARNACPDADRNCAGTGSPNSPLTRNSPDPSRAPQCRQEPKPRTMPIASPLISKQLSAIRTIRHGPNPKIPDPGLTARSSRPADRMAHGRDPIPRAGHAAAIGKSRRRAPSRHRARCLDAGPRRDHAGFRPVPDRCGCIHILRTGRHDRSSVPSGP